MGKTNCVIVVKVTEPVLRFKKQEFSYATDYAGELSINTGSHVCGFMALEKCLLTGGYLVSAIHIDNDGTESDVTDLVKNCAKMKAETDLQLFLREGQFKEFKYPVEE